MKEEIESGNNVKLKGECEKYRSVSIQRAKELSKFQSELQASKQKVSQLNKEMSDIRTEREQLKHQFEEKELKLQEIIENQKKETKDCGTDAMDDLNTEEIKTVEETLRKEYEQRLKDLEDQHKLEMIKFKEEYNERIEFLEKTHQAALEMAVKRHKEEIKQLEERNANITEQNEILKLKHQAELKAVEEAAKQATVKYFTEEINKLEILYKKQLEELQSRLQLNLVESLEEALLDKTKEVEILKESLSRIHREAERKIKMMEAEIENDRTKASQIMVGWAEEMKQIQAELQKKETTIVEMKNKIKKVRATARKYKSRFNEGHEQLVQRYKETLMEIQKRMEIDILEKEREVNLKIEQMQREYEEKEKHYRDKLIRKKIIS